MIVVFPDHTHLLFMDPLKNHKAFKQAFKVLCWAIINGVSLVGRYWPAFNVIWILSPSKNIGRVGPHMKTFLDLRMDFVNLLLL